MFYKWNVKNCELWLLQELMMRQEINNINLDPKEVSGSKWEHNKTFMSESNST